MKSEFAPIIIPANPFWKVLRTFGRDEFIAGVISILVTGALEVFFWWRGVPPGTATALVLAFAGPIFEKIGLFVGHFRDAWKVYHETPPNIRKPLATYVRAAFRGGAKSLAEDILVHDPIYAGLMFGGMSFHPETPAFLLVPIAFGLAVVAVAVLEVAVHEIRYWLFKRRLYSLGFERESYLESRLYLEPNFDPKVVIQRLRDQFIPGGEIRTINYFDYYCVGCVELPEFNSRNGKLRVRNRFSDQKPDEWTNTVQVVYTRAVEDSGELSQFRCFPLRKDKFYKMLPSTDSMNQRDRTRDATNTMTTLSIPCEAGWSDWIRDTHCSCYEPHPVHKINFIRHVVYSNEILASVDHVGDFYLIELKAYPSHAHKLKEAMRYVMHHFPVQQMTHGKSELVDLLRFDEPRVVA